jgi:hypothetical protein
MGVSNRAVSFRLRRSQTSIFPLPAGVLEGCGGEELLTQVQATWHGWWVMSLAISKLELWSAKPGIPSTVLEPERHGVGHERCQLTSTRLQSLINIEAFQ